jgi:hypothetical protein
MAATRKVVAKAVEHSIDDGMISQAQSFTAGLPLL